MASLSSWTMPERWKLPELPFTMFASCPSAAVPWPESAAWWSVVKVCKTALQSSLALIQAAVAATDCLKTAVWQPNRVEIAAMPTRPALVQVQRWGRWSSVVRAQNTKTKTVCAIASSFAVQFFIKDVYDVCFKRWNAQNRCLQPEQWVLLWRLPRWS